jgi:hypothetical protein
MATYLETFPKSAIKKEVRRRRMYRDNNRDKLPYLPPLPLPRGSVRRLSPGPLAIVPSPALTGARKRSAGAI